MAARKKVGAMFKKSSGVLDVTDKTVVKLSKNASKLVKVSAAPEIGLKNSPPFLPSIVAETQHLIGTVFERNTLEMLKDNLYIGIFINSFQQQMVKTLKLFKDAKEMMEDPAGEYRRVLTKLTLVFSHALTELKAVFGDGVYKNDYTIVKHDAREFWDTHLQGRLIVPWLEFIEAFGQVHTFMNPNEPPALKRTVDLLENNYVSRFEFDVFTRLFQPWKQILNNWNVIVCYHPGYQAFMTYDEVEATLQKWKHKPGSYVFRLSCTRLGQWAIGFVSQEGKIVQTIPQSKSLYQALIDGMEENVYIYPNGEDTNPDIRKQIRVPQEEHIKVSREQYDLYTDIESAFETCKICDARMKSMRMEPCGHLLCKVCLQSWMEANGGRETLCPFCREKVLSTEAIVVDPYDLQSAMNDHDDETDSDDDFSAPPPPRPPTQQQQAAAPALPARTHTLPRNAGPGQAAASVGIDPAAMQRLMGLGFPEEQVKKALTISHNNIEMAANILCQFGAGSNAFDDPPRAR